LGFVPNELSAISLLTDYCSSIAAKHWRLRPADSEEGRSPSAVLQYAELFPAPGIPVNDSGLISQKLWIINLFLCILAMGHWYFYFLSNLDEKII